MILHPEDSGYTAIFAFWTNANYPRRFNYQGYFWGKVGDDFIRSNALPMFQQVNNNVYDRPPVFGPMPQ